MALGFKKKGQPEEAAADAVQEEAVGEKVAEAGAEAGAASKKPEKPQLKKQDAKSKYALPEYEYPGGRPDDFFERRKWRKKVKRERKKLRKDLKERGITSRQEFELIAWELGLVLDDGKMALFLGWLKWAWAWLKTAAGLKALIGAIAALLGLMFLISYLSELSGAFTINLTADMYRKGFILADEPTFKEPTSRLFSEKCKEVNNITVTDIDPKVDFTDGAHNGLNYVAYTFYCKNNGQKTLSYEYTLKMDESTLKVDKAVWLMLFEDGHQVIYAAPSADGDEEKIFGYDTKPPFLDSAYDPDYQYYQRNNNYGIRTTAFLDENTVAKGVVMNVEPEEVHKYTAVIWVEGNDPECTDDIFGGFAKYSMLFDLLDEDGEGRESIFSGIWRTEYEDYANGKYINGTDDEEKKEGSSNTTNKSNGGMKSE